MPFGARRLFLFWLARPTMGDDIPQMRYFARLQIQGNKIASCIFVATKIVCPIDRGTRRNVRNWITWYYANLNFRYPDILKI